MLTSKQNRLTGKAVLAVGTALAGLEEHDPPGHVTAGGVSSGDADEPSGRTVHHRGSVATVVDNADRVACRYHTCEGSEGGDSGHTGDHGEMVCIGLGEAGRVVQVVGVRDKNVSPLYNPTLQGMPMLF